MVKNIENTNASKNINLWATEFTYDDLPLNPIKSNLKPGNSERPYCAVVNYGRVHGSTYRPYKIGSAAWRKSANEALANRARANFENGKR